MPPKCRAVTTLGRTQNAVTAQCRLPIRLRILRGRTLEGNRASKKRKSGQQKKKTKFFKTFHPNHTRVDKKKSIPRFIH
jgi:hypothetical protein